MKRPSKIKKIMHRFQNKGMGQTVVANDQPCAFSLKIEENEYDLKKQLGNSPDVVYRRFPIRFQNGELRQVLIIFIDGLVLEMTVRENVLKPLVEEPFQNIEQDPLTEIKEKLSVKRVTDERKLTTAVQEVLKGKLLVIIDGIDKGLIVHVEAFEFLRAVQEPVSEKAVRGARDGFIESSAVNISLLRRRISHPALQFDTIKIGEFSQTSIVIAYIKGIADPEIINRTKNRLNQIKVDAIRSSGDIEQYIEDHPYSIFSTIGNTERPDTASALLLDGRILILTDGDPVSLYIPLFFLDNIKSIEDYNSRPYYSSFIRLIRFMAFILSTTLPSLYISALNFNKEMIPSDLLIPIIEAREIVPFSLWLEIALMILMFEVVREAGVRLPQAVGPALSIVGALILGQVAVSAGLVGAPTIVIISVSYISAFIVTPIADITALTRIALLISSSLFGPFGLIVALLGLVTHMVSLTSLGVPYMSPLAPTYFHDFKDAFIRFPTKWLKHRPKFIPNKRSTKVKSLPDTGDKQ
ncbi:spore germination protein [Mesobacillus jeotgali]|uniref:spore germination protein n=1 Tax=Mesobacillus jeotgali TaxID=129985 RepID=UPI0009A8D17F|nr:spore germination protein [Mesobacillus jeotgali]